MSESMAEKLKLKPAEGKLVRFPENPKRKLAEAGEEVPKTTYWLRRLMAGDCVKVSESAPEPKPQPKPKEAKPKDSDKKGE